MMILTNNKEYVLGDDGAGVIVGEDMFGPDGNKVATADGLVGGEVHGVSLGNLFDHVLWLEGGCGGEHPAECS